jgi:hypothetical protein
MIIFRRYSSVTKTDHLKFRVDLVQALLEHGCDVERKVPGHLLLIKQCHALLKGIFLKEFHLLKGRPSQQKGVWCAINKERGGKLYFGVLTVKLVSVLRIVSRLTT